jgi:hypothetical protein
MQYGWTTCRTKGLKSTLTGLFLRLAKVLLYGARKGIEEPLFSAIESCKNLFGLQGLGRPELLIGIKYVSDLRCRILVLIPGQMRLLATAPLHLVNVP